MNNEGEKTQPQRHHISDWLYMTFNIQYNICQSKQQFWSGVSLLQNVCPCWSFCVRHWCPLRCSDSSTRRKKQCNRMNWTSWTCHGCRNRSRLYRVGVKCDQYRNDKLTMLSWTNIEHSSRVQVGSGPLTTIRKEKSTWVILCTMNQCLVSPLISVLCDDKFFSS